ncbi:peptidoglycan editing factor PgeF [Pullulanibacillus sp. KACC 23026]|uniref:peptidoglycan editing factor PgeF n=1 Tax=Pullulanibacillus sp. KACC 23026 TaxID=3028315 RepID=UPI0023B1E3DB|nr:peptidoglycan editing factor PgeF [Pullulanibacillus sp. KACC 23026]WEG11652.1 peptidoglycan editing factor PgeF [Pullulanibacillus sp. KACC 23026]
MGKDPFFIKNEGTVSTNLYRSGGSQLVIGMTTREKGYSEPPYARYNMGFHVGDNKEHVLANRQLLAEDLGFSLETWIAAEQVHANQIEKVTLADRSKGAYELDTAITGTDGLYTTDANVLLVACFADCVPLYFIAKDLSVIGIAHAGWRGTVGEIAGHMISAWQTEFSIRPEEIDVIIGPSIGSCCYEVDDRVIDEINSISDLDHHELVAPSSDGHYQLNLQLTNLRILEKYGVPESNIHTTTYCTSCRTDLFYSHRKEEGKTGRMLGFIGIKRG